MSDRHMAYNVGRGYAPCMGTERISLRLSSEMNEWIAEIVGSGEYEHASEYLRDLIRQDQKHRIREKINARLLEAIREGSRPMTEDDWELIRTRVEQRIAEGGAEQAG